MPQTHQPALQMNHKYSFNCVWSEEDEAFVATVPELPGCKADGPTPVAAINALDVIISEWIETAKEQNREVPPPCSMKDFEIAVEKFWEERSKEVKEEVEQIVQRLMQGMRESAASTTALSRGNRTLGQPVLG